MLPTFRRFYFLNKTGNQGQLLSETLETVAIEIYVPCIVIS